MISSLPRWRREMKLAFCSSFTIPRNLRRNLGTNKSVDHLTSIYGSSLANYFFLVWIYDILRTKWSISNTGALPLRPYLDYNNESWLEERWIGSRIQNWSTRLKRSKKSTDVPTEREVIAKQDLCTLRKKPWKITISLRDLISRYWIRPRACPLAKTVQYCQRLQFSRWIKLWHDWK